MVTYLVAFGIALAIASVLTPLVTTLALKHKLVDQPDNLRKVHVRAVPRLGGIAVVLAFLAPIAALSLHENQVASALFADVTLVWAFALGALGIVGLGIFDDLRGADAKLKFAVQTAVAVGLWAAGFRVEAVGGSMGLALDLGMLSLPITVLWIVGVVNAVNLIDGLDGLASGIALIAATALLGVSLAHDQVLLALMMSALAGSLVGFLFFNFNPARIFLGDSGSLFLGYVLAVASLWTHHKAATATVVSALPLFVVAVPLLDTTLCIIRRTSRGQSPFSPDREHLHHRLMALGLSHRNSVLALYAVATIFAGAGVALATADVLVAAFAVTIALAVGTVLVIRVGLFGDTAKDEVTLLEQAKGAADQVRSAQSLDAAWRQVEEALPTFGLQQAELIVHTIHDDAAAPTVLTWKNADLVAANDDEDVLVLRRARGGRVGPLTARWGSRQDAPLRAARRRALMSLHEALRDVSLRNARASTAVASAPSMRHAQVLDDAE